MSALTKQAIAEILSFTIGLNKRESLNVVDSFYKHIIEALEQGEMVKLSGFGNFELRDKDARPGRNPKTGEIAEVAARRVVTFHGSEKLRVRVENYGGEKARLESSEEQN